MSNVKRLLLPLLSGALAVLLLGAFGNRGSLYLPDEASEGTPAPTAEQRRAAENEEEERLNEAGG